MRMFQSGGSELCGLINSIPVRNSAEKLIRLVGGPVKEVSSQLYLTCSIPKWSGDHWTLCSPAVFVLCSLCSALTLCMKVLFSRLVSCLSGQ